jgi:hypothetical protein
MINLINFILNKFAEQKLSQKQTKKKVLKCHKIHNKK